MTHYLGVDVGGTNIKYALMDREGMILERGEIPTPKDSLEEYLEALTSIRAACPRAEAFVMSAPGRIDSGRGYFYTGGSLRFIRETDLAALLAERIDIPFSVENDAKCAALAELRKGSMRGVRNGVVITLGTGVGGAVILDGQVYRGTTFAAGEISWMPTDLAAEYEIPQIWGFRGGTGVLTGRYEALCGLDEGSIDGRAFFDRLAAGDAAAAEALDDYAAYTARGITGLQAVLDAERFAIGGGISRQPALIEAIDRHVGEIWERHTGWVPMGRPEITACTFGNDANLIGALCHYLDAAGV